MENTSTENAILQLTALKGQKQNEIDALGTALDVLKGNYEVEVTRLETVALKAKDAELEAKAADILELEQELASLADQNPADDAGIIPSDNNPK